MVLNRYITPSFAEVQGHKMLLDNQDSLNLSVNGVYEPFETELVKKHVAKGDIVLDVGSNIGYYALIFAQLVGESGKVIAFEPEPDLFSLLKRNVMINGYDNVTLVNKAVTNTNGKTRLYLDQFSNVDHRIFGAAEKRKSIEVETIRLDDYWGSDNYEIKLVKMDIQGAEYAALQGMEQILLNDKHLILITEYWPQGLKMFGTEPEVYLNLLQENRFVFYEIDEKNRRTKNTTPDELLQTYSPSEGNQTNLLCIKDIG
ncbi:MAG: FkbM family methyltransferase [Gammaproteobacteria bacterium]